MRLQISPQQRAIIANHEIGGIHPWSLSVGQPLSDCRFCAMFGMSAKLCSWYWRQLDLKGLLPYHFQPIYFLWTLHFLHSYSTEEVNSTCFSCSEPTFRKWVRFGIHVIGSLLGLVHTIYMKYSTYGQCSNISLKRLSGRIDT